MSCVSIECFVAYKSTDGLVVCHLPFGPTAYFTLYNVVMRHDIPDIGTISEAYPHLIFHNFTSRLGKRVSDGGLDLLLLTCLWKSLSLSTCTINRLHLHRYRISSSICFLCRRRTAGESSHSPIRRTSSPSGQWKDQYMSQLKQACTSTQGFDLCVCVIQDALKDAGMNYLTYKNHYVRTASIWKLPWWLLSKPNSSCGGRVCSVLVFSLILENGVVIQTLGILYLVKTLFLQCPKMLFSCGEKAKTHICIQDKYLCVDEA